jgi:hypothetical protein
VAFSGWFNIDELQSIFVVYVLSGHISGEEIKYYILRYNLSPLKQKAENMFRRPEMNGKNGQDEHVRAKEEMDITLRKLQVLRDRISELRAQCEDLRRLSLETRNTKFEDLKVHSLKPEGTDLLCSQCGESIEPGQEIVVKSSDEAERKHYHKECFRLLWV